VYHQEHQHVHGAMSRVIKFPLLNRTRDRSADRVALQYLKGGNLIDTYDPDALFCQAIRIPIAPKDLLSSLLGGIQDQVPTFPWFLSVQ
jgi:hypothetical protein